MKIIDLWKLLISTKKIVLLSVLMFPTILLIAQESITVNGQKRNMIVYAPKNLPANRPLIITMHGLGGNPIQHRQETNWNAVADTAMLLVVYPEGTDNRWDIGGKYDLNFIEAIMDQMYTRYAIDKNRIYISGFSMGGMMTYYTANNLAHKIAAFGPVGGYMASNANSSRAIPIMHVHGMIDDLVPYAPGNSSFTGAYFEGIHAHLKKWIDRNKCDKNAVKISPYPIGTNGISSYEVWKNGDCETEVALVSVQGVGHWFSSDLRGVHTTKELWKFFKRFNLQCGAKVDCNGDANGTAILDACGVCVGGKSINKTCTGIIQAENPCTVDGVGLENTNAGFSGSGYVNTTNSVGASVSWFFDASSARTVTYTFRYANGGTTARDGDIILNGAKVGTLSLPTTGAWETWKLASVNIPLKSGRNELLLRATSDGGLANIDQVIFSDGVKNTNCLVTGLELKNEIENKIYPNPTTNLIHLNFEGEWELMNSQGVILLKGSGRELSLSDYPLGLYFLNFKNQIVKIIKE